MRNGKIPGRRRELFNDQVLRPFRIHFLLRIEKKRQGDGRRSAGGDDRRAAAEVVVLRRMLRRLKA